jgi:hypothetical protein
MRTLIPGLAALAALAAPLTAADGTRVPSDPPKDWKYCVPGTLHIVAGVPQTAASTTEGLKWASAGDEGPAKDAKIGNCGSVAVGPDGSIYLCATLDHVIRRITPDGVIHRFAGQYGVKADYTGAAGDGGSALSATLDHPFSLAVGADGALYVLDYVRLRRIGVDGVISTVAGSTMQPALTFTAADLANAESDFRFAGAATSARLWTAYLDQWLGGTIAVAHDGTVYLHTDLGIRCIDPAGHIAPLIEGGHWNWGTGAAVGSYGFVDIALDSQDRLFATGGPEISGQVGLTSAPNIYRVGADGTLARVLGSDDSRGFFTDPDGWNVGPVAPGKSFSIQGLRFDAADRMWFQPPVDGAHFCHLDDDGVVRWSGACQTHSTTVTDLDGGPAPLNFRQNGPMTRTYAWLPSGAWVMAQFDGDGNGYPVLRVLDAAVPTVAPARTLSATSQSVSAPLGADPVAITATVTNTGTLFGELGFTSDQPWLAVTALPAETFVDGSGHLPFAVGAVHGVPAYACPGLVAAPGDYTGHVYIHLLGTATPPQILTVTMHVGAGDGTNHAPAFTVADNYLRVPEDGSLSLPLTAVDDGLPSGTLTWSLTALPTHGTATISPTGVLGYVPPHDFNTAGSPDIFHSDEQLTVQVSDGALSSSLTFYIHVDSIDDAPTVDAGPDQTANGARQATLHGSAADVDRICDATGALRQQPIQLAWSQVSGPGEVAFSDPHSATPTASFGEPGVYVLRLTADDGSSAASDTVMVSVPDADGVDGAAAPVAGEANGTAKGCGTGSGIALVGLLGLMGAARRRREA